jgi:NTE family protein
VLEEQMETQPGQGFSLPVLERDLTRMYGRGDLEQIDYELITIGKQQGLIISVTEKSWGPNFLRFGLSLNTDLQGEAQFNLMLGHKRVWVNSYGAEWINEVVLGSTRRLATEFYQPLSLRNVLFASAYASVQRAPEYIFDGDQRVATYDVLTETAGLDLGSPLGTAGEIRVGFKWVHQDGDPTIAVKEFPTIKSTETGARLLFRWDTLDNAYFPRSGVKVYAEAFTGQRTTELMGTTIGQGNAARAGAFAHAAYAFSKTDFINVGGRLGGVRNERDDLISDFNLGGFLQLSGLRTNQLSNNYLGFARAIYYHQIAHVPIIGRGVYLGGSLETGNVWNTRDDISGKGLIAAGSLFLAADTWLGPFYLAYGHASTGESSWYLFLGRP